MSSTVVPALHPGVGRSRRTDPGRDQRRSAGWPSWTATVAWPNAPSCAPSPGGPVNLWRCTSSTARSTSWPTRPALSRSAATGISDCRSASVDGAAWPRADDDEELSAEVARHGGGPPDQDPAARSRGRSTVERAASPHHPRCREPQSRVALRFLEESTPGSRETLVEPYNALNSICPADTGPNSRCALGSERASTSPGPGS